MFDKQNITVSIKQVPKGRHFISHTRKCMDDSNGRHFINHTRQCTDSMYKILYLKYETFYNYSRSNYLQR
jgi:hypothetical protein